MYMPCFMYKSLTANYNASNQQNLQMTGSLLIVLTLSNLLILTRCQTVNPVQVLDYFCPCDELKDCRTVFGAGGNLGHVYQDILQTMPACRKVDEVRCCTKNSMFTAIMILMNNKENQAAPSPPGVPALPDLHPPPAPPGSVLAPPGSQPLQAASPPPVLAQPRHANNPLLGQLGPADRSAQAGNPQPAQLGLQSESRLEGLNGRLFGLPNPEQRQEIPAPAAKLFPPVFPDAPGTASVRSDDEASTLLGLLTSLTSGTASQDRLVPAAGRSLPAGVQCVPFSECTTKKIYGTSPAHFERFGVISPSLSNCLADSGRILCVQDGAGGSPPVVPSVVPPVVPPVVPSVVPPVVPPVVPSVVPSVVPPVVPSVVPSVVPPVVPPVAPPVVPPVGGSPHLGHQPGSLPPPVAVPLPCVATSACLEVYGTKGEHFSRFSVQAACQDTTQVRCVTAGGVAPSSTSRPTPRPTTFRPAPSPSTSRPTLRPVLPTIRPVLPTGGPSAAPLSCLPAHGCAEVYGTKGSHFTRFGIQPPCPDISMVRCVTPGGGGTSSGGGGTTSGGGGTTSRPVGPVGPVAPSVSIIGPQPIYVSYNNVKGPSVGGDNSLDAPGTVHSSGVNTGQQAQIDSLLRVLKQKLRTILSG